MMFFIKNNWFKILALIAIYGFLAVAAIFAYFAYQNYRIETECSSIKHLIRVLKEDELEGLECVARFPERSEFYNLVVPKIQDTLKQIEEVDE